MYIRKLTDSVYKRSIYFVFGYEAKELREYIKKTKNPEKDPIEDDNAGQVMTFTKDDAKEHWICIEGKNLASVRMEVLVHETFHLTFAIMRYVGVEPSDDSEEALAYYQESVFKQCLLYLTEQHLKNKKRYARIKALQHDHGDRRRRKRK